MHKADINKSDRLKSYLPIFLDMQKHSTLEIQKITHSMSPATDISELRKNGLPISDAEYAGKNQNGKKIYMYQCTDYQRYIDIMSGTRCIGIGSHPTYSSANKINHISGICPQCDGFTKDYHCSTCSPKGI